MAKLKKELKDLFNQCQTYVDVFKMISVAIKQGYAPEEVNTAASWRKNRIAGESNQNYRKLQLVEYDMSTNNRFAALPVEVRDLSSPTVCLTRNAVII